MNVICRCGRNCVGYDPGALGGGIPSCYVSYQGNLMPNEYRRKANAELRDAGWIVSLLSTYAMNRVEYELYECASCGATVLFVIQDVRGSVRKQRYADNRSCACG